MKKKLRLLLVDDDVVDRKAVIRSLEKAYIAVDVVEAADIQSARQYLSRETFDCAILDYLLPDGTGNELLVEYPRSKRSCPVILLTGIDNDEVGLVALQSGAEDFLVKGEMTPSSLKRSIRYAIERYQRQAEFEELTRKLQDTNASLKVVNERLADLAITDGLTGIANRRAFQDRMHQLLNEAKRGRKFGLILADVDHFKKINDQMGHQTGDDVLITIAQTLRDKARQTDFVARYGGEEFAILLADVDEERAVNHVQRIQHALRSYSNIRYSITMSFGICVHHPGFSTADSILRAADVALYEAKNRGRDRHVMYRDIEHTLREIPSEKTFTS